MKKAEITIGKVYAVKVSGKIAPVKVKNESPYGGWDCENMQTKRDVRVRGAARFREELHLMPGGRYATNLTPPKPTERVVGKKYGDLMHGERYESDRVVDARD